MHSDFQKWITLNNCITLSHLPNNHNSLYTLSFLSHNTTATVSEKFNKTKQLFLLQAQILNTTKWHTQQKFT